MRQQYEYGTQVFESNHFTISLSQASYLVFSCSTNISQKMPKTFNQNKVSSLPSPDKNLELVVPCLLTIGAMS